MSGTTGGLNAAWDAYLAAAAGDDVTSQVRARETLYAAAQAHAVASRPLASIIRYYTAVSNDPDAAPEAIAEASQELDGARRAAAILAGAWPGTPPVVTTGG